MTTHIGWFIATWCLFFTGGLLYVMGVSIGKRYARRELTFEFDAVLRRLLHLAAKQDYVQLHGMLHELVAERELLNEVREAEQQPEALHEQLERAARARMERAAAAPAPPPDES